jgi:thiol:disulfide interchange protein
MQARRFGLMTMLALIFALLAIPASAQQLEPGPHVPMELIAESATPAPGSEVTLAFSAEPKPGWHGYWRNPGDAGIADRATWTLPEGVEAGALRYPVPERLMIAGLMNYVYEHPYALLVTLQVPEGVAPGTRLPIAVKLEYLVCTREICVPESADLETVLTVGDGAIAPERRAQFDAWRAELPKPLNASAGYAVQDGRIRIAVPWPADAGSADAYFYPITDRAISYSADQSVSRDGDRLIIETDAVEPDGLIEGVLAVDGSGFTVTAEADPAAWEAGAGTRVDGTAAKTGFGAALLAFGAAILGGLILNVMPCVFPILSLKALSLAKANAEGGNPRGEGLAYTAGVVLVCLALGATLLGLRAAGASVGWAFQLQDPRVILLLLLLVSAIAFNLAGLFEIAAPGFINNAAARGTGGAFATGALAAFVATPCTGPFMGAALGAALILPWGAALAVFAGLGLGIALPFLLLGFVPALRRALPRPGPWMDRLRRILSVPMFLTALALAWVLGRQAGVDGMTIGLAAVLVAAFGLWWAGRRQLAGKGGAALVALPFVLVALGAIAVVRPAPASAVSVTASAEAFSEARLAELTGEGRTVFAYFTADWCLTCKVNEKAVIETAAVERALADNDVAVLIGDWTDGDPELGRFIEKHNRAGVPLYLWYAPGAAEPQVLPQILTQAMLRDLAANGADGGS